MTYADYLLGILKQKRVAIVVILLITAIAYSNIFGNAFAWDDGDTIINWQATRSWASVPSMLAGAVPPGHPGNYRPVRNILYITSYHLWGTNPAGYHLQTMLLAISIALLVYGITDLLIPNSYVPLLTALFFGTHPIHVEALTWITSSMDMFGMLFGFSAVYFFVLWRKHLKINLYYGASLVLMFLALFTNEVTLSIPILLFAIVYLFPKGKNKRFWIPLLPFFALIGFNFYIRAVILHIGARFFYIGNSIWTTFLVMMRVAWVYVATLVFPTHLTVDHTLGGGMSSWSVELTQVGSIGQNAVAALRFMATPSTRGQPIRLFHATP